jgi:hypothetical protein
VDVSAIDFANGSFDSLGTMRIGQDGGGGYFFASQWDMDDMGIWKKALSDLDARGIYSAAETVSASTSCIRIIRRLQSWFSPRAASSTRATPKYGL